MHSIAFIHDLAIIMLAAGIVTVVFHLLRQPVVLGYIAAGVLIGPHTPPYSLVTDEVTIQTLAELGVVFLLFSLGLEFSLSRLRRVGATALVAALLGIVLMLWLGFVLGHAFGWKTMDALFLGAMLSISSTTITVKALEGLGLKHEHFAEVTFGILIVEDVLAIGMIAVLSSVAVTGTVDASHVLNTLGGLTVFLVTSLVIGILVVPRLLDAVARFNNNEMLLIAVLGVCFGFCLLVLRLGYSVALGAFVIGVVIAEARSLKRIERVIAPVRDMFSAIFFVAIGLLLDPKMLLGYAGPIAAIVAVVVIGKIASRSLGTYIAGQGGHTAMKVGMTLAQIGEFSFIIATLGNTLQVTSSFLYPIAVAVSALTTLFTPYLIRAADPVANAVARALPNALLRFFQTYTSWLESLRLQGDQAMVAAMVRKILLQVFVNFCLVIAVFVGGAYLAQAQVFAPIDTIADERLRDALWWGAALLLSLPFLVAAYRKLKALAMMLAEVSVRDGRYAGPARRVIAEIIPAVSTAAMMLLVFALSSSILPPADLLVMVLVIGALVLVLLGRALIRLHSRLQIALLESVKVEKNLS